MSKLKTKSGTKRTAAEIAMRQARASEGSLLRATDLRGTSAAAATKALARLAQQGVLTRVAKGLYYAPKDTLLGKSKPSATAIARKTLEGKSRPTGTTAANLLGLSTQVSARPELVAFTSHKPKHAGSARIHLRRGAHSVKLSDTEAALLELLRDRGQFAEAAPEEAYRRLSQTFGDKAQLARLRSLREAALEEPPRVRAMLGALLSWMQLPESLWEPLRESLNPISRFDFGLFRDLPNAREWQAR